MLAEAPHLPTPALTSRHLGARGTCLRLRAAPPIAGLHPAGLQALYLPSLETEERARSQRQRQPWFHGCVGGAHPSEARSWSDATPCGADGRQDVAATFAPGAGWRWGTPVTGGTDIRLAHWLPGKLAGGGAHAPRHPFDKLQVEMFCSIDENSLQLGVGQVHRKVSHGSRCR